MRCGVTSEPASPQRAAIVLANKLARIAWAVLHKASRPMKQRTDPLNPRAVLGPVKAWPGNAGARGKANATANLDRPGDGFSSITPR